MVEQSLPQSEPAILPERSFGRTTRSVVGYGLLTAMMFVSPLVVFVPTALLHCGLRNGRRAAWAALVLAIALAVVAIAPGTATTQARVTLGFFTAVVFALAIPAMAAMPLVERGASFGRVLTFLIACAALGLIATEIGLKAGTGFSLYAHHATETQKAAEEMIRSLRVPLEQGRASQRWAMVILPALSLMYIALMFVLSLLMLGRLKAWREHTAGRPEIAGAYLFRNLTLPEWLLFLFVAGGLTPITSGMLQKVVANVLAIVTFLYVLQGLAIFRSVLVSAGAGVTGTMLGWTLFGFLVITGVAPLLLGLAGLFDPFFNFRHFKRKDDSHESHTD